MRIRNRQARKIRAKLGAPIHGRTLARVFAWMDRDRRKYEARLPPSPMLLLSGLASAVADTDRDDPIYPKLKSYLGGACRQALNRGFSSTEKRNAYMGN